MVFFAKLAAFDLIECLIDHFQLARLDSGASAGAALEECVFDVFDDEGI